MRPDERKKPDDSPWKTVIFLTIVVAILAFLGVVAVVTYMDLARFYIFLHPTVLGAA